MLFKMSVGYYSFRILAEATSLCFGTKLLVNILLITWHSSFCNS
jgi:hypothetical protein